LVIHRRRGKSQRRKKKDGAQFDDDGNSIINFENRVNEITRRLQIKLLENTCLSFSSFVVPFKTVNRIPTEKLRFSFPDQYGF
jgi:hypothetical protein